MYFLIDYENTRNAGMIGTEYLLPTDHVILFYSDSTPNMEARHLIDIQKSCCAFEAYKLVNARSNALDFYISTRIGELFGSDCTDKIVIISEDNGFRSVKDFWESHRGLSHRVYLNKNIEQGILSSNEQTVRRKKVRVDQNPINIDNFCKSCSEFQNTRSVLMSIFKDTEFMPVLFEIEQIIKTTSSLTDLY